MGTDEGITPKRREGRRALQGRLCLAADDESRSGSHLTSGSLLRSPHYSALILLLQAPLQTYRFWVALLCPSNSHSVLLQHSNAIIGFAQDLDILPACPPRPVAHLRERGGRTHRLASASFANRENRRPHTPTRGKHDVTGTVGSASWASSVINLLNTIVGAGVLAMPLAMSHMGIVLGVIVILWAGFTAAFGLYLQTRCAAYLERGSSSFFALSQITYPNAAIIFDAAIAIKCFGVGISYLIIIGDLMPGVVLGFTSEEGLARFLLDRHFWVTAFMLVCIPLSYLRRLDSLKYTSVIALISISYLVVLVVYHFCANDTLPDGHYETPLRIFTWKSPVAALSSLPVIVFAYTCHQNMFSVLNEIADNSHFRTTAVVSVSIGTAAAIYILVAITGYLSFGNEVGGNIVAQYTPSSSATIGRAAIVVLVMFSYPLQVHPCRASVDAVLKWRPSASLKQSLTRSSTPSSSSLAIPSTSPPRDTPLLPTGKKRNTEISETRFAVITTVIIILSYIVAMTVSSLEAVLAYVGSTGSTSISFILPGLFYYKISSPDNPLHQKLLKEEDDYDVDFDPGYDDRPRHSRRRRSDGDAERDAAGEGGEGESEGEGLLANSGFLSLGGRSLLRRTRNVRRKALRKAALALSIYGVVVMVTCLAMNTFFIAAH
jgi:amino acid permease